MNKGRFYARFYTELAAEHCCPEGWTRPMGERMKVRYDVMFIATAIDPKDGRRKVLRQNGEWV